MMAIQTLTLIKYAKKVEKLEKEILKIKRGGVLMFLKTPISLKGMLKGAKITGKEMAFAKKSLFKKAVI